MILLIAQIKNFLKRFALVVPATRRSTLSDRAFTVAGPRAWNSLPGAIRRNSSLAVFKRSLKTHHFTQSFH